MCPLPMPQCDRRQVTQKMNLEMEKRFAPWGIVVTSLLVLCIKDRPLGSRLVSFNGHRLPSDSRAVFKTPNCFV